MYISGYRVEIFRDFGFSSSSSESQMNTIITDGDNFVCLPMPAFPLSAPIYVRDIVQSGWMERDFSKN